MLGPAIVSQTSLNPPNRIKLGFTNIYQTVTPPQEAPEQQTLTAAASPEVAITVSTDRVRFVPSLRHVEG